MDFTQLLLEAGRFVLVVAIASRPSTRDEPAQAYWMSGDGEGGMSFVTLQSLDPKRMPVDVEADDDAKDMKVRGRGKFKPAKQDESLGDVNRLELKSKRDGASACLGSAFCGSGSSSTSVRMAWDDDHGMVDGATLGFFEVTHDLGEASVVHRIEAVWESSIFGFTVRATENGEVVGLSQEYPERQQLQFTISQFGTELSLSAAALLGDSETEDDVTLFTSDLGQEGLSYCGAFGVELLGKGGRLYFDRLSLYGDPNSVDLTFGEKVLAYLLQSAAGNAGNAEYFADPSEGATGNLVLARDWAAAAFGAYENCQDSLDALLAEGVITGKRAKLLKASIKKGRQTMAKALALAEQLVDHGAVPGDTSPKLEKLSQKGRNLGDLATGQVFGLVSGCVDDVYDWADF